MNGIFNIVSIFTLLTLTLICNITLFAQTDSIYNYRRSSLYSIMLNAGERYSEEMDEVFYNVPISDKFNNHNLSVRVVRDFSETDDKTKRIEEFIYDAQIAKRMVSKWFDRDKATGLFDMKLIEERSYYNASETDIQFARLTKRGMAIIADKGEELIENTFLIVNDIRYVDKEKAAKITGKAADIIGDLAEEAMRISASTTYTDLTKTMITTKVSSTLLKSTTELISGFKVHITTYLFQLQWNDSIANELYSKYYIDETSYNESKKTAYDKDKSLFKLKFIGKQHVTGDAFSLKGLKNNEELIRKSLTRAIDKSIAELQKNYECFRVKVPIYKVKGDSIMVKVGLKEGLDNESKYEVLETQLDKNGKIEYKRVGTIKPVHIWDNRYMAMEEEAKDSDLGYSLFKSMSGKIEVGMLARQIK